MDATHVSWQIFS